MHPRGRVAEPDAPVRPGLLVDRDRAHHVFGASRDARASAPGECDRQRKGGDDAHRVEV